MFIKYILLGPKTQKHIIFINLKLKKLDSK